MRMLGRCVPGAGWPGSKLVQLARLLVIRTGSLLYGRASVHFSVFRF